MAKVRVQSFVVDTTATWLRWRRLDTAGLEILSFKTASDGVFVQGQCIEAGETPFFAQHEWSLDNAWRSKALHLTVTGRGYDNNLQIERIGPARWRVDGRIRPDLDGCDEIDLSFTPFCNSLALRRLQLAFDHGGDMTALYVDVPSLDVVPSRQRYERTGAHSYRFIDLGQNAGFEAVLDVDREYIVRHYEGLFEIL